MAKKLPVEIYSVKNMKSNGDVDFAGAQVGQMGNRRTLYMVKKQAVDEVAKKNNLYKHNNVAAKAVLMVGKIAWEEVDNCDSNG